MNIIQMKQQKLITFIIHIAKKGGLIAQRSSSVFDCVYFNR